jgi:trk system potassium uptake protein TrkA
MKQIAILGLGHFGISVLEELLEMKVEVLIIDKDKTIIDTYKDAPVHAVAMDILNVENLRKILPESIDAVVIDTGESIEASILAASYCAKMQIKIIIVKAETKSHAEILELVGATKVVFPNREAAKRITKQIFSAALLNYMPMSKDLVIAEMAIPPDLTGIKLSDSGLREKYGLNLISLRSGDDGEFLHCHPDYIFKEDDVGLFSGTDRAISQFSEGLPKNKRQTIFTKLFKRGKTSFPYLFHYPK